MKILVVMPHYPFPARAGSAIVAYQSMKYLSRLHTIDFICLEPWTGPGDALNTGASHATEAI